MTIPGLIISLEQTKESAMRKQKGKATPKHSLSINTKQTSRPRSLTKPAKKLDSELTEQELEKVTAGLGRLTAHRINRNIDT
jgi:hypothetical protein